MTPRSVVVAIRDMTSYARVIILILLGAAGIAFLASLLQAEAEQAVYVGILVALAIADTVASIYLTNLSWTDHARPRNWILLVLTATSWCVTIGYVVIAGLVAVRAVGITLPTGLGQNLTGAVLVVVGSAPIMKAATFFVAQRDTSIEPGIVADLPTLTRALGEDRVKRALDRGDDAAAAKAILVSLVRYASPQPKPTPKPVP